MCTSIMIDWHLQKEVEKLHDYVLRLILHVGDVLIRQGIKKNESGSKDILSEIIGIQQIHYRFS